MKFETLGRHILVEYYNCDEEVLKNPKLIEEFMNNSALNAKATIVDSVFHHFNPWGVSGAVIIAESHLTIHTWPEYGYAAADFFTCGDIDPWKSFELLEELLKAERSESTEIPRGLTSKIQKFKSCIEHNGDTDIHAINVNVIKAGIKIEPELPSYKVIISIGLIMISFSISSILYKKNKSN